jgi:stage II sporulation protein D
MKKTALIMVIFLFSTGVFASENNNIRVLVARQVAKASLAGQFTLDNLPSVNISGNQQAFNILPTTNGFSVNGQLAEVPYVSVTSYGSPIYYNGRSYIGSLIFRNEKGLLSVINVLPIEEYLVGLVASEMPKNWPTESLKAQAVVARTYAMFQRKGRNSAWSSSPYDVESTVLDQVYRGNVVNDKLVRKAVEETKGEYLTLNGKLLKTFFSSTCGGKTESAKNVWNEAYEIPIIEDPYCSRAPNMKWNYTISKVGLVERLKKAGFKAQSIDDIKIERRPNNPRVATIQIDIGPETVVLQGNEFRKMLGYNLVKSTWFDAKISFGDVHFRGRGYGHGVGMCQWGAKGMAEAGKDYRQILEYYYPGARIEAAAKEEQVLDQKNFKKIKKRKFR